jgi:hypothetical protein
MADSNFDFFDICAKDKYIKQYGIRTKTVEEDLGQLS